MDRKYGNNQWKIRTFNIFTIIFLIAMICAGLSIGYAFIKSKYVLHQKEVENEDVQKKMNAVVVDEKLSFGGHQYQLFDGDDIRWMDAKKKCEKIGGHLVTITSADEQQFIEQLIDEGEKTFYWIGATDSGREPNNYYWVTGETFDYQNWQQGQPDNGEWGAGEYEDFAGILRTGDNLFGGLAHTWNDFRENPRDSHGYICEWDY